MNDKVFLLCILIAFVTAIYQVIRTVLIQRAVEHGMPEHEAQKRYESLFSLLRWKKKQKKQGDKTETAEPASVPPQPKRMQTRWTGLGAKNVRRKE